MKLPKIMEDAVRRLANIPADIPRDEISIGWDDRVYGSDWGCGTCGYGAPSDTLTVDIEWPNGQRWSKEYEGYRRLSDFFEELEALTG